MTNIRKVDYSEISKLFLKLYGKKEVTNFLQDFFTKSEIEIFIQRWEIAKLLNKRTSYKEIERTIGCSSATIAKVNEKLKYGTGAFQSLLSRVK